MQITADDIALADRLAGRNDEARSIAYLAICEAQDRIDRGEYEIKDSEHRSKYFTATITGKLKAAQYERYIIRVPRDAVNKHKTVFPQVATDFIESGYTDDSSIDELLEMLNTVIESPLERQIIDLRIAGNTVAKVAAAMKTSSTSVLRVLESVRERFNNVRLGE